MQFLFIAQKLLATVIRVTADSLKKNSIYVVQLNCAYTEPHSFDSGTWTVSKDNITVTSTWFIEHEDLEKKLSYQRSVMNIKDENSEFSITEDHILRAWTYTDIQDLVKLSACFTLEAIYTEDLEKIERSAEICGKMGNLYYILRKISN